MKAQRIPHSTINPVRMITVASSVLALLATSASAEIVVDLGARGDAPLSDASQDLPGTPVSPAPMTYTDPQTGQTYLVPPPPAALDANGVPIASQIPGIANPPTVYPIPVESAIPAPHAEQSPDQFADQPRSDAVTSAQASVAPPAAAEAPATESPAQPSTLDLSKIPQLYVQPIGASEDASIEVAVPARQAKAASCNDAEMMAAIFRLQSRGAKMSGKHQQKLEALKNMRDPEGNLLYPEIVAALSGNSVAAQAGEEAGAKLRDAKLSQEVDSLIYAGRAQDSIESLRKDLRAAKLKMNTRVKAHIATRRDAAARGSDRDQFAQAASDYVTSFEKESQDLARWAQSVNRACKKLSLLKSALRPASPAKTTSNRSTASTRRR